MTLKGKAEGWIKQRLAAAGIAVSRRPAPLLVRAGGELGATLPMVVEYHLARHRPERFFFVQIGAFDGITGDPIHPLVVRHGWSGVVVEPQPGPHRLLVAAYGDQPQVRVERLAVAATAGRRTLYTVAQDAPGLPAWAPQLASFHRETILAHEAAIPGLAERIDSHEVECVTLDELLRRAGSDHLDLLQVDTEGADAEIVGSLDLSHFRPAIVRYEHKHLGRRAQAATVERLLDHGYRVAIEPEDTLAYLEEPG